MNTQQIKTTLWFTCGALLFASAVTIVWGLCSPYGVVDTHAPPSTRMGDFAEGPRTHRPVLATFGSVWNLNLRRPLYDQPARVAAKPTPKTPALPARLVGTVIEPGRSVAMFITKAGKIELLGIGETVGNMEVLAITHESATVRHASRTIELTVEQEGRR